VQYPWEDVPRRAHRHRSHIASFYMDRTPVTNAEFNAFLDATHYHPEDDHNFLRDWKNGSYADGWDKYLLMSPGRDRAGTIGFRCVVDAQ
jgi:formylglycine-generating enzyme required for sulfatase activity